MKAEQLREELRRSASEKVVLTKEEREKSKQQLKLSKEQEKKSAKERNQLRKDVLGEARKSRADAAAAVLQCFDEEDVGAHQGSQPPASGTARQQLADLLASCSTCTLNGDPAVRWDSVVAISNTLLLFRDLLKLTIPVDVDSLCNLFVHSSSTSPRERKPDLGSDSNQPSLKEEAEISLSSEVKASAENEEVWDETAAKAQAKAASDAPETSDLARAYMERILLSLLRLMTEEMCALMEMPDKDRPSRSVWLPLNQQTWQEHARMLLVARLVDDCSQPPAKIEEKIQIVRGNRGNGFRSNKNVVRNIRYVFAAASRRSTDSYLPIQAPKVDFSKLPTPPNISEYTKETEIESALDKVSLDDTYDMGYRRCARVLSKLLRISASKNLTWEVDSNLDSPYYSVVKRPIFLVNIAWNLVSQAYGEESDEVTVCFYRDVAQTALNSYVFASENASLGTQATKLLHVLRRHMELWVWGQRVPPVDQCTDHFCVLTGTSLPPNTPSLAAKCGKCSATFSWAALLAHDHFAHIMPSPALITNHMEEWCCALCIQEESAPAVSSTYLPHLECLDQLFTFTPWGLSGSVPWVMNTSLSLRASEVLLDNETKLRFEALKILSTPERMSAFCLADKIVLVNALCDLLRYNAKCIELTSKLQTDCGKLLKTVSKDSFREAELLEIAKAVVGDSATCILRSLFDGTEESSEANLQSLVIDGRCGVCKGSTYDLTDDDVVLCDGCDGEAHLKCLNLTEVSKQLDHK